MVMIDFKEIEKKWQKRWEEAKIFEANPDDREKFFITAAFPYLNGVLHAGHLRTFTIPEVVARFQRMKIKTFYGLLVIMLQEHQS